MTATTPVAVRLVPVEPTEAMLKAWDDYRHNTSGKVAWSAMLAAAPVAPAEPVRVPCPQDPVHVPHPQEPVAPAGSDGEREQLAKIIDPEAFDVFLNLTPGRALARQSALRPRREAARVKADLILAARVQPPAGEAVACTACMDTVGGCDTCGGFVIAHPADPAAPDGLATTDDLRGMTPDQRVIVTLRERIRMLENSVSAPDGGERERVARIIYATLHHLMRVSGTEAQTAYESAAGSILAALRPAGGPFAVPNAGFIATCKDCGVAFDLHLRDCPNARPAGGEGAR